MIHSQCEFSSFRVAYAISSRLGAPIVHTYHTVYEDYTHYFSPSVRVGKYVVSAPFKKPPVSLFRPNVP